MKKPILDIIITHCNEPVEVGTDPFHMLFLQRIVREKVRIIIVQDGKDGDIDWTELMQGCPFAYDFVTLPERKGVSAARNAGLKVSDAEWVMFMDFDDMFSSVYSLNLILNVLPTDGEDCLYTHVWREEMRGGLFVNILKGNFTISAGKLYRRKVLADKNIMFNTKLSFRNSIVMNEILYMEVPAFRIKEITTDFALVAKTMRLGSFTNRKEAIPLMLDELLTENIILTQEAKERAYIKNVPVYAVRAMFDAYYIMNMDNAPVSSKAKTQAVEFIKKHIGFLDDMRDTAVEVEMNHSSNKMENFVQYAYNYFGLELLPPLESISDAKEWLKSIAVKTSQVEQTPAPVKSKPVIHTPNKERTSNEERVVVYCGTENTYESMVISAKTLLAHTQVDKIYFLTEHDTFPIEIPDIITNINVSKQTYFNKDCPNYSTPWTYMCLMRAVYTKLLPQHDKVLSLDIDIAVNDDISDLWDYDISDYYLAGVPEIGRPASDYINFGVVMMNLAKLRADHMDSKIINALNTKHWDCPEQSAFSALCAGHILCLPSDYNYIPNMHITAEPEHERITHYAGIKYWKHLGKFRQYAPIPWNDIINGTATTPHENGADPRVVIYAGTRNLYDMMELSARSLLKHTPVDDIYFLIEDDTFPRTLPDCIHTINVSNQSFFDKNGPNYNSQWTYMVLMRAAIPHMFPQYRKVLSIDADTLIHEDISPLFDTDLSDAYFAAVCETRNAPYRDIYPYYNCGVCLMNLDKLRNDGVASDLVNHINTVFYRWNEQDALNELCQNRIVNLPSRYNAFPCTEIPDRIAIRHYVGNEMVKKRFFIDAKQEGLTIPERSDQ